MASWPVARVLVEPGQAHRRGGVRAGAEGEARIEPHDHGALRYARARDGARPTAAGRSTWDESRAAIRVPTRGRPASRRVSRCGSTRSTCERPATSSCGEVVERKQRLQARVRPQPEFTGRRLEDRIVALVGVRHGERAELEAGLLDALGIEPVEIQRESQLRHVRSPATSGRGGAPGSGCPGRRCGTPGA